VKDLLPIFIPFGAGIILLVVAMLVGPEAGGIAFFVSFPILMVISFAMCMDGNEGIKDGRHEGADGEDSFEAVRRSGSLTGPLDESGDLNINSTEYLLTHLDDDQL
jgi:hypothetical protein